MTDDLFLLMIPASDAEPYRFINIQNISHAQFFPTNKTAKATAGMKLTMVDGSTLDFPGELADDMFELLTKRSILINEKPGSVLLHQSGPVSKS